MTGPSPVDGPRPARSLIVRSEVAALVLAVACGLGAWAVGLRTLGYDYDEVTRAHSAWLASRGLRPYNDFFECHPPYFALLGPVVRGRPGPMEILEALRVTAAAGNLLFLGGLAALGASMAGTGKRWAWLGLAAVAFHPAVLQYLVEFRVDGWGYALAAWSLYRHRRLGPGRAYRDFEVGVLTGVATLLFCPKLTILPALVVAAGTLEGWSARRAFRSVLAYSAGVGVAGGLFASFLAWEGIDLGRMSELLIRYHAVGGSNASFRLGLLNGILGQRALAWLTIAGVVAWGVDRLRRRARPGAYEVALLGWLAAQAVLVAYPYKQYFAPWFLFASGYLGSLGQGSATWLRRARMVPFLAACAASGLGSVGAARDWSAMGEARSQARLIRWMGEVAGPEDRVVGSLPLHPVDRLDTFFVWFNTADPGGFDSERILSRLPTYREVVAPGRPLEELEAHPPAFVVLSGDWRMVPYTAGQDAALARFLPTRGYRIIQVGPARFAVRPDRLDRARRAE